MIDPNDFTDQNNPEGEASGNPKAGQEGVGGLSTEEAEKSYKAAANQHFNNQQTTATGEKQGTRTAKKVKKKSSLPQIGSMQDDEIKIED